MRFRLGDRPIEVDEVIDRWLAPDHRYFEVRAKEGIYILRNDVTSSAWELTRPRYQNLANLIGYTGPIFREAKRVEPTVSGEVTR